MTTPTPHPPQRSDPTPPLPTSADHDWTVPCPPGEYPEAVDHDPALAGWDTPVPLGQIRTLPAFPIDVLPGWVADMVTATAVRFQTPVDLPGCLALAALSVAAGGRAVVRIREGWEEPINLYTVVIMDPSARKSPPFRAMTAPLRRAEQELVAATAAEREQARITRAAAHRARERAEQDVVAGDESTVSAAVQAALTAADVDIPPLPRLLADDLTPETAANLLSRHGGRLAVLSPEGGLFDTIAGRYSGGTPNLDIFLKAYTGETKQVDRIGRDPEFIDRPALTIGLTVQPAVIEELSRTRLLRGSGLLARFLYCLPPNNLGYRLSRPPSTPATVADAYDTRLRGLVKDLADWTDPAVLPFAAAADDVLAAFQDHIEPKLNPQGGEWAAIRDWAGKLAGQVARLAGLLHCATHLTDPWQHPVTADTLTAACRLGDYFTAHALTVFDQMGADPAMETARQVLAWLGQQHRPRFTRRDAYRDNRGERVKVVADVDPALTLLEDHGHIRLAADAGRAGPGRKPSPTYLVHPCYWQESAR